MSKAVKVSPMLNHDRLRIIRKGHASVSDLQKFIPASRSKAQAEYQTIAREIEYPKMYVVNHTLLSSGVSTTYIFGYSFEQHHR